MPRRPLIAVGLVLTVLGAVLLTWVMQRGAEPVRAAASVSAASTQSPAPEASASARPSSATPTTSLTPTTAPSLAASPQQSTSPDPSPKPARDPGPVLRIASVGIEAPMAGRGLSSDGTINPRPGTVMWFTGYNRVRPGAVGTSVIAAHVSVGGKPDEFADLSGVAVGDVVEVLEDGSATERYRVTGARAINKTDVTTDQTVWGPNTSTRRLAIITCDDAFGFRGDGHRKANFVVIAERV
ncbi:MAG: class F sortase [Ornithinibacter sp.]